MGLSDFVSRLSKKYSLKIISTGGTAKHLIKAGFKVITVEKVTKFPEILSGRVKTLHPKIHGAILADQNNPKHLKELKEYSIKVFDMVIVNLYPFEKTIKLKGISLKQAIEQIDIGGVALLRAGAKNFKHVLVICDLEDYGRIAKALEANNVTTKLKKELAVKVFEKTSHYDVRIARYLSSTQ